MPCVMQHGRRSILLLLLLSSLYLLLVYGTCITDRECNDGNPLTLDWCIGGECKNPKSCEKNADCVDNECNRGYCESGICAEDRVPWCTCDQCRTADPLREPYCYNYTCVIRPLSCTRNSECEPSDERLLGACRHGKCHYSSRECTLNSECHDHDSATMDECVNGKCQNNVPCIRDLQCADEKDLCSKRTCGSDGFCQIDVIEPCECNSGLCSTSDPCKRASCDNGKCVLVNKCCCKDSDCNDHDDDTVDECDFLTRACLYRQTECNTNEECNDGVSETVDSCIAGKCYNVLSCVKNTDCSDVTGCVHRCVSGSCEPLGACLETCTIPKIDEAVPFADDQSSNQVSDELRRQIQLMSTLLTVTMLVVVAMVLCIVYTQRKNIVTHLPHLSGSRLMSKISQRRLKKQSGIDDDQKQAPVVDISSIKTSSSGMKNPRHEPASSIEQSQRHINPFWNPTASDNQTRRRDVVEMQEK